LKSGSAFIRFLNKVKCRSSAASSNLKRESSVSFRKFCANWPSEHYETRTGLIVLSEQFVRLYGRESNEEVVPADIDPFLAGALISKVFTAQTKHAEVIPQARHTHSSFANYQAAKCPFVMAM
jgi:hypothetical protein